ncbi:hypothetical protein BSKO_07377 [Bryopsis sp. KO-2023]|nr:hypothetical protein BSKO_07377 [Bryopsis sp. KO-2023]
MESDADTVSCCSLESDPGLTSYLDEILALPEIAPMGREFYCFACRRENKRGHVSDFDGLLQHCRSCTVGSGRAHRRLGDILRGRRGERDVEASNGGLRNGGNSRHEENSVREEWDDPNFTMTKEEMAACMAETSQNVELLGERQDLANQMLKAMEKDAKVLATDLAGLQARLSSLMLSASVPESLHVECGPAGLDHQLKELESDAEEMNHAYETCVTKLTGEYEKAIGEGDSFLSADLVSVITKRVKELMDLEMAVSRMEEEAYEAAALHQP